MIPSHEPFDVTVPITFRASMLADVDARAERMGASRSEYIDAMLRAMDIIRSTPTPDMTPPTQHS